MRKLIMFALLFFAFSPTLQPKEPPELEPLSPESESRVRPASSSPARLAFKAVNFYFNPYSKESRSATIFQAQLLALTVADSATTQVSFSRGGLEADPIMAGREPWTTVELLGLSGLVNYASKELGRCHRRACRIGRFTLLGLAIELETGAVRQNLSVIHLLSQRRQAWR